MVSLQPRFDRVFSRWRAKHRHSIRLTFACSSACAVFSIGTAPLSLRLGCGRDVHSRHISTLSSPPPPPSLSPYTHTHTPHERTQSQTQLAHAFCIIIRIYIHGVLHVTVMSQQQQQSKKIGFLRPVNHCTVIVTTG